MLAHSDSNTVDTYIYIEEISYDSREDLLGRAGSGMTYPYPYKTQMDSCVNCTITCTKHVSVDPWYPARPAAYLH